MSVSGASDQKVPDWVPPSGSKEKRSQSEEQSTRGKVRRLSVPESSTDASKLHPTIRIGKKSSPEPLVQKAVQDVQTASSSVSPRSDISTQEEISPRSGESLTPTNAVSSSAASSSATSPRSVSSEAQEPIASLSKPALDDGLPATARRKEEADLNACFDEPGANWKEEIELLQKNPENSQFAIDQPREAIRTNDGLYPMRTSLSEVHQGLVELLGEPHEALVPHIEYLLVQNSHAFGDSFRWFTERYVKDGYLPPTMVPDGPPNGITTFDCQRVGNTLRISSVKYFEIRHQDTPHKVIGYDARRFEVVLDLSKAKMPDGIRTAGCSELHLEQFGMQEKLSALLPPNIRNLADLTMPKKVVTGLSKHLEQESNRQLLQRDMPTTNESLEALRNRDPELFIADTRSEPIRVNGRLFSGTDTLRAELRNKLTEQLKRRGFDDEKKIELVRWQLEALSNQVFFILDPRSMEEFHKRYTDRGFRAPQDAHRFFPELAEVMLREGTFRIEFRDKGVFISATRYFVIESEDGRRIGYDAVRFQAQIKLNKMKAELLFTPGCTGVSFEHLGLHERLVDVMQDVSKLPLA